MRCQTFYFYFFPCSADHERDWPPCKVVFFGLPTNALNVRNNNNNNNDMPISCVCKRVAGTILNSCNDLAYIRPLIRNYASLKP